ncbi:hypothetical protein NMY22_g19554 [Coprinellus aureogranulatus]|nr:hypothetical protein NMY22_g19554 [Coprinellus aureogranulatus]
MESARASKVSKLFDAILSGKTKSISSQRFPSSLRGCDPSLPPPSACTESTPARRERRLCSRHCVPTPTASINNGELLRSIILKIVHPPIFWDAFRSAFRGNDSLSPEAQVSFAWLLLQLVSLPPAVSAPFRDDPDFDQILNSIIQSDNLPLRTLGYKIRRATDIYKTEPSSAMAHAGSTPGGRHDNDFADFRDIAIRAHPGRDTMHGARLPSIQYLSHSTLGHGRRSRRSVQLWTTNSRLPTGRT